MSPEYRPKSYDSSPISEYLKLPKGIGDVPSEQLFRLSQQTLDFQPTGRDDPPNHSTQPQIIAASALVEGVLVEASTSTNIDQVDTHLDLIDIAQQIYEDVADTELANLEQGFKHPDDQEAWLRAMLQLAFIDTYKDIACGEVTVNRTKPELLEKLVDLRKHVATQIKTLGGEVSESNINYRNRMKGLEGELAVFIHYWSDFNHTEEIVALPSTYRGGDGQFFRKATHDVVFAQRNTYTGTDTAWHFSTAEVKRGNKRLRLDDLVRYDAPLIQVGYDRHADEEPIREVA
jgi:hypothetical protein